MPYGELVAWVLVGTLLTFPMLLVYNLIRHYKRIGPTVAHDGGPQHAFNNIAVKIETLVGLGRLDENTAQDILESVINSLTIEDGWVDVEESIVEFQTIPFIVQAFKNCGYELNAAD